MNDEHAGDGNSGAARKKPDYFSIFLMIACLALSVLVVMLAMENRRLKEEMAASHAEIPADALKTGDPFTSPTLVDDGGTEFTLEFGGEVDTTLLLVFSSQCPACEETLPIWAEMMPEYSGLPRVLIVGLQLDRLSEDEHRPQLMTAAFPFPVYGVKFDDRDVSMKRIPYIPAAILINNKSEVVQAWYGLPDQDDLDELEKALKQP